MGIVRAGMMLTLLMAGICSAQTAPKQVGYDLAACAPDGYYGVHMVQDGKDLVLDEITTEPGVVKTVAKDVVRYVFKSQKDGISTYEYTTPDKAVLQLVVDFKQERGIFLQDGRMNSVVFVGEDADGNKLANFAVDKLQDCVDLLSGPKSKT